MLLMWAMMAAASPAGPDVAISAWHSLMQSGCDVQRAPLWTPIEARVLRNVPYALRGRRFASTELTTFFSASSDAIPAAAHHEVVLEPTELACVQALAARELELRALWPDLGPEFERRMIASPQTFAFLWEAGRHLAQSATLRRSVVHEGDVWVLSASMSGCPEGVEDGENCEAGWQLRCAADTPCEPGFAG